MNKRLQQSNENKHFSMFDILNVHFPSWCTFIYLLKNINNYQVAVLSEACVKPDLFSHSNVGL